MSAEIYQDDLEDFYSPGDAFSSPEPEPIEEAPKPLFSGDLGLTAAQVEAAYDFAKHKDALPNPLPCEKQPDMWFSPKPSEQQYAKYQCTSCPIIEECRRYAEVLEVRYGVWAGHVHTRQPKKL